MRQSKTAGRIPGSARRLALGSLGAGLAVVAAAPMASAAAAPGAGSAAASDSAGRVLAPVAALTPQTAADWAELGSVRLYPLAGSPVDPLSNVVGTDLGGLPVSTRPVTNAFANGLPISDLPVVGTLFD